MNLTFLRVTSVVDRKCQADLTNTPRPTLGRHDPIDRLVQVEGDVKYRHNPYKPHDNTQNLSTMFARSGLRTLVSYREFYSP